MHVLAGVTFCIKQTCSTNWVCDSVFPKEKSGENRLHVDVIINKAAIDRRQSMIALQKLISSFF